MTSITDEERQRRQAEADRYRDGPVMRYINEGHTIEEAAERFMLPVHVVRRIRTMVSKLADPRDKPSRVKERAAAAKRIEDKRQRIEVRNAEILRLRAMDMNAAEIGTRVNLSANRVAQFCRDSGVPYKHKFALKNPRLKRKSPDQFLPNHGQPRRERIHQMMSGDAYRTKPPITLPRVSILEGIED